MLIGILPRAVGTAVLKAAGIDPKAEVRSLGRNAFIKIARTAKNFPMTFDGTKGFQNAQVTRGGINIKEFDGKTLESKKCPDFSAPGSCSTLTAAAAASISNGRGLRACSRERARQNLFNGEILCLK